jgi:hypothetical protein
MEQVSGTGAQAADPARCPLCGQANGCAMEAARAAGTTGGPCWCMSTRIPVDVLAGIPASRRGIACVCERCARGAPAPG